MLRREENKTGKEIKRQLAKKLSLWDLQFCNIKINESPGTRSCLNKHLTVRKHSTKTRSSCKRKADHIFQLCELQSMVMTCKAAKPFYNIKMYSGLLILTNFTGTAFVPVLMCKLSVAKCSLLFVFLYFSGFFVDIINVQIRHAERPCVKTQKVYLVKQAFTSLVLIKDELTASKAT